MIQWIQFIQSSSVDPVLNVLAARTLDHMNTHAVQCPPTLDRAKKGTGSTEALLSSAKCSFAPALAWPLTDPGDIWLARQFVEQRFFAR